MKAELFCLRDFSRALVAQGNETPAKSSPDLAAIRLGRYCGRFWAGFRGGGGLSPLTACGSNLRVTLTAAWLRSSRVRRPSSITVPDFLLKFSASSRSDF